MPDPKKDPFMRSAVSEGDNAVFSQVSKMEIEAYDKKNQKTESRKVSINPENYARSFSSRTKESEPRKMVDGRSYVIKTVEFIGRSIHTNFPSPPDNCQSPKFPFIAIVPKVSSLSL